jgi:hypothetical protein
MANKIKQVEKDSGNENLPTVNRNELPGDCYDDYEDVQSLSYEDRYKRSTQWGWSFVIKTPVPKLIEHLYLGNTLKSDWIEPDVYATEPLEEFGIWEMPDYLTDHQVDAERDELFVSLTIKLNNTDH